MHLKSLVIHGFKSFGERTSLTFLPPVAGVQQLTAIVGPNGSGKSNVADAIRWVMGETSLKSLRSKKSEDIIFSGSDTKGKMGLALVSMTFENRDHRLPLEYEEVVITRRMDRTGESEYTVNNNPVRLFDLQVLLAQAQFGHGSYSIIGQGMIDRLLLLTPAERKDFFDEACGIKEFQIKRHQASLKLERTREHMAQAELLLAEITPRLKSLSRQMKKLEEREALGVRLREAQEAYYHTIWSEQARELAQARTRYEQMVAVAGATEESLARLQAELAELAKEASREEQFQFLQQAYQACIAEKQELAREEALLAAKLQTQYTALGKEEMSWLVQKIDNLKADQVRIENEMAAAQTEKAGRELAHGKLTAEYDALAQERQRLRAEILRCETELWEIKNEQVVLPMEARALQAVLERQAQFGTVFGVVAQLGRVDGAYQLALDVAAGAYLSSLVVETDLVAERCIRYLRDEKLGVATFLPLNTIKPRLVPHDIDAALRTLGVHGLAKELVAHEQRFEPIFSYIFGATLIVDDIAAARRVGLGRYRMVTLTGDVLETSGSMKGGYRQQKKIGFSFSQSGIDAMASQEKKEQALQYQRQSLQALEEKANALSAATRRSDTAFAEANHRLALIEEHQRRCRLELARLSDDYALHSADPSRQAELISTLKDRQRTLQTAIVDVGNKVALAAARVESFHGEEERKRQRVFALQDSMQQVQIKLNQETLTKNETQIEMARLETKQEDVAHEATQELHEPIENIIARSQRTLHPEQMRPAEEDIQKLKYALTLIGGIDEQVAVEYRETLERHTGLACQLDDLARALADLHELTDELDTIMKKKRAQAWREIRKEFSRYFGLLFGGGKAELVEIEGDGDVAVADDEAPDKAGVTNSKSVIGIDIVASPPGKRVSHIQALSGGERTMTAIALLCAILHTNPAPFVLLDEVEAALDEANTIRFGHILKELSRLSQFIIITHNRATMHIADTLYGVAMGADGMSHLLSVRLEADGVARQG